jgi:hypothetical protein
VSPPSPGPDDAGTAFGPVTVYPDGDATTIDTPAVAPGSTVCVRARSVDPFSGRQSAWTGVDLRRARRRDGERDARGAGAHL